MDAVVNPNAVAVDVAHKRLLGAGVTVSRVYVVEPGMICFLDPENEPKTALVGNDGRIEMIVQGWSL